MAISLKHTTQAVGTDAGNGEIRKAQWNEEHALTAATNTLLGRATAGTGAVEEIACTAAGRAILDDADAAAQRTTLGLAIGTNVQAWDADLDAFAALAATAGFIKKTGANAYSIDTVTYAPLASPTFTGTPAAPSAAGYTDTTQIATTAQVYDTVTTVPENAQTGTTYTLVLTDAGKMVTLSNAAAITLTIPTNASVAFPTNTRIDLAQFGAGQVTVGGAGVTIRSSGSKLKLAGQYSGATLWKKGTDEWLLVGDITA